MSLGDSDFFIDIINNRRQYHGRAVQKVQELEARGSAVFMSVLTRFELATGIEQFHDPESERRRVHSAIQRFPTLPLSAEAAERAGLIHGALARDGIRIGLFDTLIASVAIEHDESVLTRNVKHFGKVQGLMVETY